MMARLAAVCVGLWAGADASWPTYRKLAKSDVPYATIATHPPAEAAAANARLAEAADA